MGLRFEADLELESDGRRFTVTGDEDGHLVVTTDGLAPLLAGLPEGTAPVGTLRLVSGALAGRGATVRVQTPERGLLTLGAAAAPGWALRTLGLDHVEIESVWGVAVAAPRRVTAGVGVALTALGVAVVAGRRRG